MTNDQQRALINRIAYNLLDRLDDSTVTKKFKKLYQGGTGAKNVDKNLLNTDAIGLPNIEDNVMENDKIKSKFMTTKKHSAEVNGETQVQTSEEPDNDKMAEATNRAIALTHAYALFIELNRIQDEQDVQDSRLTTLEANVADLQKRVKTLEDKVSTLEKKTATLESDVSNLKSDVKWLKSKHTT